MKGKNWNSKLGIYTDIAGDETLSKAKKAQELRAKGYSVKEIAENLGLSTSRIYEFLKQ